MGDKFHKMLDDVDGNMKGSETMADPGRTGQSQGTAASPSPPVALEGTVGSHNTPGMRSAGASAIQSLVAGARPLPEYELVEPLGRGGFGEVWKAVGPGGFEVALKFIRLGDNAGRVELRALELMKGIRHAHLLPLFGAWRLDEQLVVAMELADRTLLQRLKEVQTGGLAGIPRDELLEYLREAAKGLDYLNEYRPEGTPDSGLGIQHRDVKPQNLLLVGGTVKVADFGLARVLEHTAMTASGSLTPGYTAPEFLRGQATRWSDQYCLAVTYCHLRGGRLPFVGSAAQVMAGHMSAAPDLTMVPEAERPAVARALAKNPVERWPNCRAFAAALTASAATSASVQGDELPRLTASANAGISAAGGAMPAAGLAPSVPLARRPVFSHLPPGQNWVGWFLASATAALIGWAILSGQLGHMLAPLFQKSSAPAGPAPPPATHPQNLPNP
jgi:serine/threonine protein kinase